MSSSTTPPPERWASLADRLNPNRAAFDPHLKASWKSLAKSERKRIVAADREAIRTLRSRGGPLPFDVEPDDHCETGPAAYAHVAPVLRFLAERLGKEERDLTIYDPYYCAGGAARHLGELGFPKVYNKGEDFYEVIARQQIPAHDVVVTNPPYSGDHFDRLLAFLVQNGKPALLLLPDHFDESKSPLYSRDAFCHLSPPERYHYWTPVGMRPGTTNKNQHRNLVLGTRTSPFASHWFVCTAPVMPNEVFVSLVSRGEVRLAEGCHVHAKPKEVPPTTFKGAVQIGGEDGDGRKKRRRGGKEAPTTDPALGLTEGRRARDEQGGMPTASLKDATRKGATQSGGEDEDCRKRKKRRRRKKEKKTTTPVAADS